MQKFKTMSDAIALAEFAHRNQVDKAGLPYIDHPRRVLESVKVRGALPYVQMAAILHDVTEDTAFTPEMLIELGVPEPVVKIVKLVDRDISYEDYKRSVNYEIASTKERFATNNDYSKEDADRFYYTQIRKDSGARMVKLADIQDNLNPWRMVYLEEATQERLKNKYRVALRILGHNA